MSSADFDNSAWLRRRFAADQDFAGTVAPEVLELTPQRSVLRMVTGPSLHQHFGGPHAAILFGLGELASYALLMRVVGDLAPEDGPVAPLVKTASIGYTAIALGPVVATAVPADGFDEQAARDRFAGSGGLTMPTEVVLTGDDGGERGRASYRMGLKRF